MTQPEIRRLLEVEAVDVMTVDSGQTEGRSRISGESVETWILNIQTLDTAHQPNVGLISRCRGLHSLHSTLCCAAAPLAALGAAAVPGYRCDAGTSRE